MKILRKIAGFMAVLGLVVSVFPVYAASNSVSCAPTQHSCACATGNYCLFMGGMCLSPNSPCPVLTQIPESADFGQQVKAIAINIGVGSRNNNVKILQQFLMAQNKGSAAQALAKVGASSYFGVLTRRALAEFQASVGIKPAWGNFGAKTRAYLVANY